MGWTGSASFSKSDVMRKRLSPWQTRFLDLWIDGYGAPPNDDDELLAPNEGGAAFETTFTGPLPSPTYLVRQGSTTLLGGKLPVKTSDLEGEPRGGAFLTWP